MTAVEDALERGRIGLDEGLALADGLETVDPDEMIGTWAGAELASGHFLDGLLEATGWWGKQFVDAETVHPLLFHTADRRAVFPVNPALMPIGEVIGRVPRPRPGGSPYHWLIAGARPLLAARRARARLRATRYRGRVTATMIYDDKPINDLFWRIDDDALLGVMDLRGGRPYFFTLRRDDSKPVRDGR